MSSKKYNKATTGARAAAKKASAKSSKPVKKNKAAKKSTKKKPVSQKKPKSTAKLDTKAKADSLYLSSIDAVCKFFKVSRRSYIRKKDNPHYPSKFKQGYYIPDVQKYLEAVELLEVSSPGKISKDQEMAKKIIVQRKREELKLKKDLNKVIEYEQHYIEMNLLADICIRGIDGIAHRVSAQTDNIKVLEIVEEAVKETRNNIAEELERVEETKKDNAESSN